MTPAKGFAEMKDSGIEWMGEIPTDWEIVKLKYFISDYKAGPFGSSLITSKLVTSGNILVYTPEHIAKKSVDLEKNLYLPDDRLEDMEQFIVKPGDIIFPIVGSLGRSMLITEDMPLGIINQRLAKFRLTSEKLSTAYFLWLFSKSSFYNTFIELNCRGSIIVNLTKEIVCAMPVPLPPLDEQSAIAAYLDTQCVKIDEIIAQAKASIEDYRQWKASIIYDAVTKGLDPNVEMKDSGIEWIGRMPSDWAIIRVKNLLAEINDRSETGSEEPLSMSQVLGIVPSSMIAVANPATSYVGAKIVRPNDLVFNKLKAHLGVFAVSNYDGLVSPDYAVYRANERANPKFLEYLFKTPNCIQEFKKYITGVGAGLSRLYTSDLFNIKVALPVIDVQKHIVEYLNDFCSQADALIDEKQSLIDDLESYKKSLIYEVVTGKRRVC